MAKKLKDHRQILVEHIKKTSSYSMGSLDVYDDCYSISYIVSGDRTFSLSGTPYERYGIPEDQIPEIIQLYEAMLQEYEHYTKVSGLLISEMLYRLIVLVIRKKSFITPQNILLNI